jgi:hypothetical protein
MRLFCPWSADLTFSYLERLLNATRETFELHLLRDCSGDDADPARAIVRHDVDLSLSLAVTMAEYEAGWKVASTYHVLLDAPLYRLDDTPGHAALRRLSELGHEIGLHIDVGDVNERDDLPSVIEQRACAGRARLEELIDAPVESVSFHRPAPEVLRGPDTICGMVNAFGKTMMANYLSDSEGRWRHGEPIPLVRATTDRLLQLLIHPVWWADHHLPAADRLQEFFVAETQGMTQKETETFDTKLLSIHAPLQRSGRV